MTCSRLDSGFCTLWVHEVCLLRQAYNVFQIFQLFVKRFDKGLAGLIDVELAGLIDVELAGFIDVELAGLIDVELAGFIDVEFRRCDTGDKCGNNKPAHF